MRQIKKRLLTVLVACSPLFAQVNPHQQLGNSLVLEQQGQFDQAIAAARLAVDSNQLSRVELGRAYILLGAAYREEGKLAEAQAAFERSLHILDRDPEHVADYAAALNNYAGVYSDAGQLEVAGAMWLKALHLRQQSGDHAAVVRSFTNLAGLALTQGRVHEAKRYLQRASDDTKLTHGLIEDDFVILLETQAWLAMAERHPSLAVARYQRALELCQRTRGEQHWLTGWEHMLRGKAYAQSGDFTRALADIRQGLAIFDRALGRTNPKYFAAQIVYSQVLDRTGSHAEAARLRARAEQDSKDFYGSQCVGCTINIAAFP